MAKKYALTERAVKQLSRVVRDHGAGRRGQRASRRPPVYLPNPAWGIWCMKGTANFTHAVGQYTGFTVAPIESGSGLTVDLANDRFDVNVTGKYHFSWCMSCLPGSTVATYSVVADVQAVTSTANVALQYGSGKGALLTADRTLFNLAGSGVLSCTAGDTVILRLLAYSGHTSGATILAETVFLTAIGPL